MKKHFLIFMLKLVFVLVSIPLSAQVPDPPILKRVSSPGDSIVEFVDEPAEFPGGGKALMDFIKTNLKYPESALKDSIQGRCHVKLLISDQGEVQKIQITKNIPECPDCDKEVIRIMRLMPRWKPGRVNGKNVNSYYRIPVTFRL